jgi:heme/copper-type cytochrome/quinol oxidase subunit 4
MWIGGLNLFSINKNKPPSKTDLRKFGFVLAVGFAVIGLVPVVFRHLNPRGWAVTVSLLAGVAAAIVPAILRYPYFVWMTVGNALGWVNSRIILGAIYYMLFAPARGILMLLKHDPMNREYDRSASSYRVARKTRPPTHMDHQF